MELLLERIESNDRYTIGRLSTIKRVDDEFLGNEEREYLCDTLESKVKKLADNNRKITVRTAIAERRYPVVITYCERQDSWLPLLLWVRKFKDVRIQVGKTVEDIQTGDIIIGLYHGDGRMVNSLNTMKDLKRRIVEAKAKGEGVWLNIKH